MKFHVWTSAWNEKHFSSEGCEVWNQTHLDLNLNLHFAIHHLSVQLLDLSEPQFPSLSLMVLFIKVS